MFYSNRFSGRPLKFRCAILLALGLVAGSVFGLDYGDKGDGSFDNGDFTAAPISSGNPSDNNARAKEKPTGIRERWASAIANDDTAGLLALFERAESVENLVPLTSKNGKDALMVACKTGDIEFARRLVAEGANVNKVTFTGGTPFMFSVLGNEQAIAKWLYGLGANIDAQGSNGWSAMTIAAAKGQTELLRWLISIGADVNAADVYQFSPLMRAVDTGHIDAVAELLNAPGIKIDSQDEANNTALHYAVVGQRADMVTLLLQAGANRTIQNRNGQSAQTMAQDEPAFARLFEVH